MTKFTTNKKKKRITTKKKRLSGLFNMHITLINKQIHSLMSE